MNIFVLSFGVHLISCMLLCALCSLCNEHKLNKNKNKKNKKLKKVAQYFLSSSSSLPMQPSWSNVISYL